MPQDRRVFVVQKSIGKNLTPALQFGRLVTLLEPYNVSEDLLGAISLLRKSLATFSDDDYLLAIGSPTAMILAGLVAAHVNGGKFNLLEWDRQCFCYRAVTININTGSVTPQK